MYEVKEKIDNGDGTATLVLDDWIESTYGTECLICGKFIPCGLWATYPQICEECKQAVLWAKYKMKEKDNG